MCHQLSKLVFLGRRLTASVIVLLLVALMASGVGAHPAAGVALHPQQPAAGGVIAAPTPAPRSAPLSPPAGDLDPTFGSGGQVMTAMGSGRSYAHAVAIQHDGKIVAAGQAQVGRGNNYDFGLTRYNSNGALDASFGSGGLVTTDFGSGWDYAYAVAIQGDGKIVAAGQTSSDFARRATTAMAHWTPPSAAAARLRPTLEAGVGRPTTVAIQDDGKIVAVGGACRTASHLRALQQRWHAGYLFRRRRQGHDWLWRLV